MKENKTQPTSASVEGFIANIANPRRKSDCITALSIYKSVSGLPPVLWGTSIIGFGTLRYKYDSGREGIMPRAGFSPRKANMTFYIDGKFEGADTLFERLGKHKRSVACLYVNRLEDVNLEVLGEIIALDFAENS